MIRTFTTIRPVLLLGLALMLIFLAGCSSEAPELTAKDNPAPRAQAVQIQPATGGGSAQATHPESAETGASLAVEQPAGSPENQLQAADAPAEAPAEGPAAGTVETAPADQPEAAQETQPEAQPPAFDGPLPPVDPTVGNLAPDFSLGTMAGSSVSLVDLRGKAVVLNYWVTWCVPCREEMPEIEAVFQEYEDDGLVVLSVNGTKQDAMADIEAFLGEVQVSFPVLLDHSEQVYNDYRILFMPTTFFIDPHGVIQDIVLGSTNADGFRSRVEQLVSTLN